MAHKRIGRRTVRLETRPAVVSWANIGGKMEGAGPLAAHFDELDDDPFFGQRTWEQGESAMQSRALRRALGKGGLTAADLDYVFAGDLLNQCVGSTFALRPFGIPCWGIYGACSTMGEGLALAAMVIDGGFARLAAAVTSSHFCTAERQYRTPVPYGSQRTPTAQWTATAAGCCVLGRQGEGPYVTHVTCGRIVDLGVTDANNMGAAMAPAACDTLAALFRDTGTGPADYDLIVTGDLGALGHTVVTELMARSGYDMGKGYTDCGLLLFDREKQDMHAGGSGAGCSAAVLNGYLLKGMRAGTWRRIVFAPTGALLSPTTSLQGESIPGICHAVVLSRTREV
jgi:stage V sporulation protein AD